MKSETDRVFIYKITCFANGMSYIGQSKNPQKRFYEHMAELRHCIKNKNCYRRKSKLWIEDLETYGEEWFSFEILDVCSSNDANQKEGEYIEEFCSGEPNGYNIVKPGCFYGHCFSVTDMSNFTGIPKNTIYEWVNRRCTPSVANIVKLAEYFNMDAADLFNEIIKEDNNDHKDQATAQS